MFYGAHVLAIKPLDLRIANFREPGSPPPVLRNPGEWVSEHLTWPALPSPSPWGPFRQLEMSQAEAHYL